MGLGSESTCQPRSCLTHLEWWTSWRSLCYPEGAVRFFRCVTPTVEGFDGSLSTGYTVNVTWIQDFLLASACPAVQHLARH